MAKWQTIVIEKIWLLGAIIIEVLDGIIDDVSEILKSGAFWFLDLMGGIIAVYDWIYDWIAWGVSYFWITTLRKIHNSRIWIHTYRRQIISGALYFIITGAFTIWLIASVVDYSYSYNGRVLGIVKEQRDVLEILDLVSEELTQEYKAPIAINGDEDISFNTVISVGKQVDKPDDVLKKFTYMGDIQTKAYGLFIDGNRIGILQSEKEANAVVDNIVAKYLKKDKDYESYGVEEKVEVQEVDTTLAKISSRPAIVRLIEAGTVKETVYTASEGDTFKSVAEELDVSVKSLKDLNPALADLNTFSEGQNIVSQSEVPILTVRTVGLEVFAETIKYETETIESDEYYDDEEFVRTEGSDGKMRVTARVTRLNGELVDREDVETEVITEAVNKVIVKGTKERPLTEATGTFIRPVPAGVFSGFGWRWGRMHEGVDLAISSGTPIKAADGGTVVRAGWYGAYGLCVDIDHGKGIMTRYGHCSSINVSVGDQVFQGQVIARVGSTGRSTGPHCHFEIRVNGVAIDPTGYI